MFIHYWPRNWFRWPSASCDARGTPPYAGRNEIRSYYERRTNSESAGQAPTSILSWTVAVNQRMLFLDEKILLSCDVPISFKGNECEKIGAFAEYLLSAYFSVRSQKIETCYLALNWLNFLLS